MREEFEILQKLGADGSGLDRSNLPPVFLPAIPSKMRGNFAGNPRALMEVIMVQSLIQSYFKIVQKNIADMIPKTIMAFLINESRSITQQELVREIYQQSNLKELLVEDPVMQQKREARKKEVDQLRIAQKLLNEVANHKI
jgi:dynamin 1-like protein